MASTTDGVQLRDEDRATLMHLTRSSSAPAGVALRARIVLGAAGDEGTSGIARRLGVSRPTVITWRERYRAGGIDALVDAARSGRPKTVDDAEIVARTLAPPPKRLGVTHWSSRLLAGELGIGDATVARCWRRFGLQPWRRETFKFSTDPELEAKVRDVIGLYLDPTGKGDRAVRGREEPDPGPRPDRADPAPSPWPAREGHPRLRPPRHHHLVRRARDRHGEGDRRVL